MAANSPCQVLSTSHEFLDGLVKEFESECRETLRLLEQLKKTKPNSKLHQRLESSLYGRLISLQHDLSTLIKEWDRVELEA